MRRLWIFLASMLIVGAGWAQDEFGLDVLRADLPADMGPDEHRSVTVVLANLGSRAWIPDENFFVAAHWFRPDGGELIWDGPRTDLPGVVNPGETVSLDVLISTPAEVGPALIQFDVVQEGVFWLSRSARQPLPMIPVSITRHYGFSLIESRMSPWASADGSVQALIRLRNDGSVAWEPDGSFGIVAHWQSGDRSEVIWEGRRNRLPRRVGPGETVFVVAGADVPDRVGRWLVRWDVVHEGVCWLSQKQADEIPPSVVVVLPECSEGWPAFGATLVLAFAALGFSWGWWGKPGHGRNIDLIWLVTTPWLVERTVTDISIRGGVVSFSIFVLVAALVGLSAGRWRPIVAWLIGASVVTFLVGDRVYLRFFQDLPSVASFEGFGQTDRLGDSIQSLLNPGDVVLLASGLLGFFVCCAVMAGAAKQTPFPRRLYISVICLACVVVNLSLAMGSPTMRQVFRRVFIAQEIGVVGAHWVDIGGWFGRRIARNALSPSEVEGVERWFRDRTTSRTGDGRDFGIASGMNVIMIQAESLQAFVPGLRIDGHEVTPTLNRWARQSLVFDRVTDQTGHGRSSDAELLTQVSLLPLSDGAAAFLAAQNRFTSLAGVLADRGYTTLSAVPFDRTFWNRSETHPAYGYAVSLFAEDFDGGETVGWGLSDREFLSQMSRRLADLTKPFCVWLITLSLHHPFEGFPESLEEMSVGRWSESPVGAYLHTMRHFDTALAAFENELETLGLLDSTVIAVWGDHDAGFEWTPEVARLMGVGADKAGWYVSQRVPLIVRLPAHLELDGIVSEPAGHVDVAPTIAALLGIHSGDLAWMGRNLLGDPSNEPVVGEYDCWLDRRHVFLQGDGTLEGGVCLDGDTLLPVAAAECADGFAKARKRVEIAQRILRHDLQEHVTAALQKARP